MLIHILTRKPPPTTDQFLKKIQENEIDENLLEKSLQIFTHLLEYALEEPDDLQTLRAPLIGSFANYAINENCLILATCMAHPQEDKNFTKLQTLASQKLKTIFELYE